jgi:hypothetical protein
VIRFVDLAMSCIDDHKFIPDSGTVLRALSEILRDHSAQDNGGDAPLAPGTTDTTPTTTTVLMTGTMTNPNPRAKASTAILDLRQQQKTRLILLRRIL